MNNTKLDKKSIEMRKQIVSMMACAGRGHPASAFSLVEILRVLYDDILKYNPKKPKWDKRDRFILSKGHGCLALYVVLAEKGFFPKKELEKFCAFDGLLGGHPEILTPGIEASTGSLGHGLSIGLGMAINAKFEKSNHKVFVVLGDGETDEGSVWEAALCAGKHKLDNLIVILDYNKVQSYGLVSYVQNLEPIADKWKSFGFEVREVDGHNLNELKKVFSQIPFTKGKPSMIICHTVKGKGVSFMEGNAKWHHVKPKPEELKKIYKALEV
ncbi:MAG: transketolase [Nanoarchaeota archaeon]|nr:transketolase [Nanoarchaeota archaeon]MBU1320879.1 transketolase [Nanoarchaeota archaeon]MBU1597785.1 transketolase [Nanoarchaeota archaeon]MBU2441236.1 transketolase [Nanoarchaeota archaeon]